MTQAYSGPTGGKGDRVPNPLTAAPAPGQPDKRVCHWYQKVAHIMGACPDRKAGKPRTPAPSRARSAAALEKEPEKQEWVEDRNLGGLFREFAALDTDWQLNAAEGDKQR